MDLKNSLLFVVAFLNILIGFYVYSKNWKSQLRLSFLLLTISVALWSVSIVFSNNISYFNFSFFWPRAFNYLAAGFIAVNFLWLTMLFPFDLELSIKKIILLFSPLFVLLIIFIIYPSFIIYQVIPGNGNYIANYNILGYSFFSFYFLSYISFGFYYLTKRYFSMDGILRSNIKFLLVGLGIGVIWGVICDLILPFGNYWELVWLGPYFTLAMVYCAAYIMFRK